MRCLSLRISVVHGDGLVSYLRTWWLSLGGVKKRLISILTYSSLRVVQTIGLKKVVKSTHK